MTRYMKAGIALSVVLVAVVAWTAETAAKKGKESTTTASAPAAKADTTKAAVADTAKAAVVDTVRQFTLEELAKCDGKEGRPSYIAVDGVVYDVANAKGWKNGEHQGFKAGRDVTKDMQKKSPHGAKPLTKLPKVGVLAKAAPAATPAK